MQTKKSFHILLAAIILCLFSAPAWAGEDYSKKSATAAANEKSDAAGLVRFGGPDSVGETLINDEKETSPALRIDALDRALKPYFGWKNQLNKDYGVNFGLSYTGLFQGASESPGDDSAGGGIFQAVGQWTAFGRGTSHPGTLVFKAENRHTLGTDIPPNSFGKTIGSATPVGYGYADFGWGIIQLNWKQQWQDGKVALIAGRVQPIAYLDTYAMASPLTGFLNQSFSYNPTIAIPSSGLGAAAGGMVSDNIYIVGSLSDANGSNTDAGFDTFFDDNEYFKHVELGWTSSHKRLKLDNIHLTLWHADEREAANKPEGHGVTFSGSWFVNDTWLPFLRAGWSDGDAAALEGMVSAGLGYYFREASDLLGAGFGWGKPSGTGRRDQYTTEIFYRFQLAQNLAVTPDIQWIIDPADNPSEDQIWVYSIRARLAF